MTHIFDEIRDFGPVYNFWSFLFERLNKVLKSYATNGHKGGELEVSFFRAFERDVKLRAMVCLFILNTISIDFFWLSDLKTFKGQRRGDGAPNRINNAPKRRRIARDLGRDYTEPR